MDMAAAIGEEVAHVHAASHEASHRLVALREQLRQEVQDSQEFHTALATLSRIVNNARQHPHDTKYHRIRPANPKFHSSAGRFTAAVAILVAAGFRRVNEKRDAAGGSAYEEVLLLRRFDPVLLWLAADVLDAAS
ncbi:unnamed protein product [Closterium sp. NIES-65]|nr:unnamed protein product [Closterium sp. NIES-65]